MKLSETDRDIICCIQNRARDPIPVISELTGHQVHTVRRSIRKLKENHILEPFTMIDLYPLGFTEYGLFFSLRTEGEGSREKLLEFLLRYDAVAHLSKVGGEYQYHLAIYARHESEYLDHVGKICDRFPNIIVKRSTAVRTHLEEYGRQYLSDRSFPLVCLGFGERNQVSIDETDNRICDVLSRFPDWPPRDVVKELGIPHSTYDYRVKKLEEKKIISGYGYRFDAAVAGMHSFRAFVSSYGTGNTFRRSFSHFCREQKHIVSKLEVVGEWDYEITIEASTAQAAHDVVNALQAEFRDSVRTVSVFPAFKNLKSLKYLVLANQK